MTDLLDQRHKRDTTVRRIQKSKPQSTHEPSQIISATHPGTPAQWCVMMLGEHNRPIDGWSSNSIFFSAAGKYYYWLKKLSPSENLDVQEPIWAPQDQHFGELRSRWSHGCRVPAWPLVTHSSKVDTAADDSLCTTTWCAEVYLSS